MLLLREHSVNQVPKWYNILTIRCRGVCSLKQTQTHSTPQCTMATVGGWVWV